MSETRTVMVRAWCGNDSRAFLIKFRMEASGVWKALSTWPDNSPATSAATASRAASNRSVASVPLSEMSGSFEWPEDGCAHCTSHDFFKCGCGALVCQGRSEMRLGQRHLYCPQCGRWGALEGYFTSLQGEELSANLSLPAKGQETMHSSRKQVATLPSRDVPHQVRGDSPKLLR